MKNLADKAYNLSVKYDMGEEAKLIQIEEQKLDKLIHDNFRPIDFDPTLQTSSNANLLFEGATTAAQSIKYMDDLMVDGPSTSEKKAKNAQSWRGSNKNSENYFTTDT